MTMSDLRFQPPGCSIWIVRSEDGPSEGRFVYAVRPEDGAPCNPELHVGTAMDRAQLFALAIECEQRWQRVQEAHEARLHQQAADRAREAEAAARWDEIRRQWEARKRRVAEQRQGRPAPAAVSATPACIERLGLAWPCGEQDVRRAFRELAKASHPDRGGSASEFIELRRAFEDALELLARVC
jgi:hypothetical protein